MRRVARGAWLPRALSRGSSAHHVAVRREHSSSAPPGNTHWDAAAAAADAPDSGPVAAAVSLLEAVHSTTGLPWWLSIATTTVCVRAALAPLAVLQARASSGLSSALAVARRKGVTGDVRAVAGILRAQRQSSGGGFPHPAWLVASPLVQLPVFVTALLAVRRAALLPLEGMACGGAAWFVDLTQPALDWGALAAPAGPWGAILPATAVGLMMLNIQHAFGPPDRRSPMLGHYKLFLEWLMVPTLAAGLALPQAVFCYWIPSNAWTLAQSAALRRLYALPPPAQTAPAQAVGASASPAASVDISPPAHGRDEQQAPQAVDASALPPHVASLVAAAATARAAGRKDEASTLLAEALAAEPEHPRVAFAAGQLASAKGQWRAAADHYAKAARLESDPAQRSRARFGYGVALVMLARANGRADCPEAEEAFALAAKDTPNEGRPYLALESLLRASGKHAQARQAAAKAAALDPRAKAGGKDSSGE